VYVEKNIELARYLTLLGGDNCVWVHMISNAALEFICSTGLKCKSMYAELRNHNFVEINCSNWPAIDVYIRTWQILRLIFPLLFQLQVILTSSICRVV